MDIPCAILIGAFCLPDVSTRIDVKSGPEGSDAIAAFGEVRVHILLSDEEGAAQPQTDNRLCYEGVCVAYSGRVRPDAGAVELLIASNGGRERFIQLRGPLEQIAAISSKVSYVLESDRGWVQIPLGEFKVAEQATAAAPETGTGLEAQEPGPGLQTEPPAEPPPELAPELAHEPELAPVPEVAPEPEPESQPEPEWLKPNRPY